jgi:hypothetical protein
VDLQVSVYGTDGAVIGDASPGNKTGIYFVGCEARGRGVGLPASCRRTDAPRPPAPPPRAAQHDTLRGVLQLTDAGSLPACLAGLTYASRCDLPPVRVRDGTRTQLLVKRNALLTLMFVNCGDDRVSALGVDYTLMNPGGQNLPTAEAPLPVVYLSFSIAWGLMSAACSCAMYALREYRTPLHGPLMSVPLLKVVHMAVAQSKWSALSKLGVRNVPLDMTLVVALTVSQVNYLGMLLLLSRGWHVSRTSLGAPERNSLLLSLALLASLYFVYYLWSPKSFFALAVAYICVLGFALSSVSYGLRHLKAQAHLLRMSGSEADDAAAWVRVRMFAGFHGSMFIFTCVKLVLHLVALFMPEEAWLNVLFAEARAAPRARSRLRAPLTHRPAPPPRFPTLLLRWSLRSSFGRASPAPLWRRTPPACCALPRGTSSPAAGAFQRPPTTTWRAPSRSCRSAARPAQRQRAATRASRCSCRCWWRTRAGLTPRAGR